MGTGGFSRTGAGITTLRGVCLLCSAASGLRLREQYANTSHRQPLSEHTLNLPLTPIPVPISHQLPFQLAYLLH